MPGATFAAGEKPRHLRTLECRVDELLQCAALGDISQLAAVLDEKASQLPIDTVQWTPRRLAPHLLKRWPVWSGQPEASALHCAAETGQAEALHLLLERSATPDLTTRYGVSPLHLAACGAHVEAVKALLSYAPVDARRQCYDIWGQPGLTPLHMAACAPSSTSSKFDDAAACAELLLAAEGGALSSLHAVDAITGRTALHFAAETLNAPLCRVLVAAGAWLQVKDLAGETPLSLARSSAFSSSASSSTQREEVMRELRWLPSVRMLWLAHQKEEANVDADEVGGRTSLRDLTRDVVRLIAAAMVSSHVPSSRDGEEVEENGAGIVVMKRNLKKHDADEDVEEEHAEDGDGDAAEDDEFDVGELALAVRTLHESTV